MYDNIPNELKQRAQWICYRLEWSHPTAKKPDKIPYSPRTGYRQSVTDRAGMVTFEDAVKASANYDGIGFCFTKDDPYCGIDLDDSDNDPTIVSRQYAILGYVKSYAEFSPSGKGIHIICRANLPGAGRRRDGVEIYDSGRFFTMTGNVYRADSVNECSNEVIDIWSQMSDRATLSYFEGNATAEYEDRAIYDMGVNAANGDLFQRLWGGDWSGYKANQHGDGSSEADFALVDLISFYSGNREQIARMFLASALGQRPKYALADARRRNYLVARMVDRSFDRRLPEYDLSGIINSVNQVKDDLGPHLSSPPTRASSPTLDAAGPVSETSAPPPLAPSYLTEYDLDKWRNEWPRQDSLLAWIGHWIWSQSARQAYETSLAASLAFMSGLCGRSYNVSGTGLNQYVMLLGTTGIGKETMRQGIVRLIRTIETRHNYKPINQMLGPSDIASGQALYKYLGERKADPCFVSILGEVGLTIKRITHDNANSSDVMLRKAMLDIYGASAKGSGVLPTVYADKTKNTDFVPQPAFSLLGEGVPETFYEAFDETAITTGLLPRFTIIEHNGQPARFNKTAQFAEPPVPLCERIVALAVACASRTVNNMVIDVPSRPEGEHELERFEEYCYHKLTLSQNETLRQLWNRAHLKVLKLSAILAISENENNPWISADNVLWAISLVLTDILALISKFESGKVGETKEARIYSDAHNHIRKVVARYLFSDASILPQPFREDLKAAAIIPLEYISRNCVGFKSFKGQRQQPKMIVRMELTAMIEEGLLLPVEDKSLRERFQIGHGRYFTCPEPWRLKEWHGKL